MAIKIEQPDIDELKQRRICGGCVGEKYLKHEIRHKGQKRKCFYCGRRRKTMEINEFANYIEQAFEDHFELRRRTSIRSVNARGKPRTS